MGKVYVFLKTVPALFVQLNCIILAGIMALSPTLAADFKPIGIKKTESVEFADSLGTGWNLGDTLDAIDRSLSYTEPSGLDSETLWANPYTTKEMIACVKDAGFGFIRIPVTWRHHFDTENGYKIDKEWLDRVQQIVDWSLECGLKAIINIHHDTTMNETQPDQWFIDDEAHYESTAAVVKSLWGQIADRFKDYDENLIFEIFNEPGYLYAKYKGHGNNESRAVLNKLNTDAFETIRAAGGKNDTRYVLFPTHGAVNDYQCSSALELPDDPHVLVSVHCYVLENNNIWKHMLMIQKFFLNRGYGTVITEFGSQYWYIAEDGTWIRRYDLSNEEDRKIVDGIAETYAYYVNTAEKFGISCCIWDDGQSFLLFDRRNLSWRYPQLVKALTGHTVE